MTSRVIAKRLGDLPTYGLGYNTGALLYSEEGSNYQIPMTNFLTASKSFDVGFTITSIKEEIVYGGQRLVWTGIYPKTVPSGSTPDTTGGIGTGGWAYSNDSVLRENLRSSEGAETIGTTYGADVQKILSIQSPLDTIATLRNTEPPYPGCRCKVTAYRGGWVTQQYGPLGGGDFYHDPDDLTTDDDGIFTFVTPTGARWKRIVPNNQYDLAMGGILPGDDCTAVFKTLVAKIVAEYTSKTTSGNTPINYNSASITAQPGTYIVSSTIQLYTVTPFISQGYTTFDGRSVTSPTVGGTIFKLSNDGLLSTYIPKYMEDIGPILNGSAGTINITGSNSTTVAGITVGNTVSGCVNFRGSIADNVSINYCGNFIKFDGTIDTYLMQFTRIRCYGSSGRGITFPNTSYSNSGERISFDELVVGGSTGDAIYIAQPGIMLSFSNTSIDFTAGNCVTVTSTAGYSKIDFSGSSHLEGFAGYAISNLSRTATVSWNGGQWLPTDRSGTAGKYANYQGRPLVYGEITQVKLRDVYVFNSYAADNDSIFLGIPQDDTKIRQLDVSGLVDTHGYVPSKSAIANRGFDFSLDTVGTSITSSVALFGYMKPADLTYWISGCTATIVSLSDGTKALQIVPTTTGLTTNYLNVVSVDYIPVQPGKSIIKPWAVGQILTSTLKLRIDSGIKWYDSNKTLLSTTPAGTYSDLVVNAALTTSPSYSSDATVNGNRKLATLALNNYAPAGAYFAKAYFTISGIDQTVNINQLCYAIVA